MGGYMRVHGYAIFLWKKKIFTKHIIKIQICHRVKSQVTPILSSVFTCMPPIFSMFIIIGIRNKLLLV